MKIDILSRSTTLYSTKRLLEEAKNAGHKARAINVLHCDIKLEKHKPSVYYHGERLPVPDAVIPRIGASITFYGTAIVRQFEMMNCFTTVSSQALVTSRDKLQSLQKLARSGVGMPKTVFTNFGEHTDDICEQVGGPPVVIKVLEGTQGIGVNLAESLEAADAIIDAHNDLRTRVIIQEFIKEAGGADLRAFVVGNKVVGAMKRQAKKGEFRSNLHRGGTASKIKLTPEEERTALAAAKALGLGVCGVDLLQSSRGPLVLEVNSSPGLEGIEGATGYNIAREIIKFIEKNM
ncbi:MAG: 30S ribosomal protein S6--L-glutamate ligase [Bacteroidota bacterium]|uniref:30S ribosomal protein S6--L-glutamate ligase n=1 Tax=Nonlabens tegetincola TaxID=323273 RepID=UPI000A207500|nr:30S ribosomal protein S6--L-glutamate ligase [Nonlabens tegetincola]ARN72388.1 alpha-L-glutamate ligase [Nonlabens tegetincola]MEE2802774.1 30S ribosomal protein S6--L-glutamate ligase [Bacteroidota bacterium]